MALDKRWMEIKDKGHPKYKKGVDTFLKFAFGHPGVGDRIRCPCNKCRNVTFKRRGEVRADLRKNGIYKNYTEWHLHGEEVEELLKSKSTKNTDSPNDGNTVNHDGLFGSAHLFKHELSGLGPNNESAPQEQNAEAANFRKLLEHAERKLYPGCKHSSLSVIEALPEGNSFPDNYHEAEKMVKDLLQFGASTSIQPSTREGDA